MMEQLADERSAAEAGKQDLRCCIPICFFTFFFICWQAGSAVLYTYFYSHMHIYTHTHIHTHTNEIQKMQTRILTNTCRCRARTHTLTHKHQHSNTCTRHLQSLEDNILRNIMQFFLPYYNRRDTRGRLRSGPGRSKLSFKIGSTSFRCQ